MTHIAEPAGVTLSDTDERARQAVKVFRTMQSTFTSFAKVLTRNPKVRVEMRSGGPAQAYTDGERIFYQPPIELGDKTPHSRQLCDKRDADGRMECPACAVRETVLVSIYHEICHIAYDSFAKPDDESITEAIKVAVAEHGTKYSKAIEEKLRSEFVSSYAGLAQAISPYMTLLTNGFEDARIESRMFETRPGTRVMFSANVKRIFAEGVQQPNGEKRYWKEYPLNTQAIFVMYLKAAGYEWEDAVDPKIAADLAHDPVLDEIAFKVRTSRSMSDSFSLAFKALARLRELGYCKSDHDPEDCDEEEESDEQDTGDGRDDSQEGEPGDGDDSDDSSDSGSRSDDTGDSDGDSDEAADESDDPGAQGDSSESDESGAGGDGESDDEASEPESESETGGGGESTDDSEPTPEGGGDADEEITHDETGHEDETGEGGAPRDQADTDGDSSSQSSSSVEPSEPSSDDSGEQPSDGNDSDSHGQPAAGNEEGDLDDPFDDDWDGDDKEADSSSEPSHEASEEAASGSAGKPAPSSGDEFDPSAGDEQRREVDRTSDGSSEGEDGSGERDVQPDPEESGEPKPIDMGADDGQGGVKVVGDHPEPDYGDEDDAKAALLKWLDHEEKPDTIQAAEEREAIDKAIVQGIYFEHPSSNVFGVREHEYDKPIVLYAEDGVRSRNMSRAWEDADIKRWGYTAKELGKETDSDISESILGPALAKMRRAFADNRRGRNEHNLKSGRVNNRALGKRAWNDDPRLFKKKLEPGKRDYFVVIMMDISASTIGLNLAIEKRAVMAQATLLHRMGIKFAIFAESSDVYDPFNGSYMNRCMEVYQVKKADEPWNTVVQKRLETIGAHSGNLDGHALEYARRYLDRQKATDKIILFFSDGKMPAENHDEELEILQREIRLCKQRGYTLLGVGIRTDSPTKHGLPTVQLDEVEEIGKVVDQLGKNILAQMHR